MLPFVSPAFWPLMLVLRSAIGASIPSAPIPRRRKGGMATLRRILGLALRHRGVFALAIGAQVLQIALSLISPILLKSAIDNGLAARDYRLIVLVAIATIGIALVREVVWYAVSY